MFDVVIVGGGTSGVAAAYIAAKRGLKTLLVEKNIHLGGAITSGLVLPAMDSGVSNINRDFYTELVRKMAEYGAQINFQGNAGWFNPEVLKIVLDEMLTSVGVELRFSTKISSVEINPSSEIQAVNLESNILSKHNDKIHGDNAATLREQPSEILSDCINAICGNNNSGTNKILLERIETRYVIDATGNCEIANLCGCEFLEESPEDFQPVTLRFIMSGINNDVFAKFLREVDSNVAVSPIQIIDGVTHFSTAYTWDEKADWALRPIFKKAVMDGVLTEKDCNYFQIFSIAGCNGAVAFNCPRMLERLDLSDAKAISTALIEARKSIFRLANFCKKYLPGFEKAYISNIADELGIRVSRRVKGKYIYTEKDLKSGKAFTNPVLKADYPIDIHSNKKDGSTLEKVGHYQLPIESLMTADINNLFVIGRGLSAEFKAQAALRVQLSCFSMGEAVAKHISLIGIQN